MSKDEIEQIIKYVDAMCALTATMMTILLADIAEEDALKAATMGAEIAEEVKKIKKTLLGGANADN